jgi:hypothetical protein
MDPITRTVLETDHKIALSELFDKLTLFCQHRFEINDGDCLAVHHALGDATEAIADLIC